MSKHNPGCSKRAYRTGGQAEAALQRFAARRPEAELLGLPTSRRECRWYWCAACDAIHPTSKGLR